MDLEVVVRRNALRVHGNRTDPQRSDGGTGQEGDQIQKVTPLPDEAAPSYFGIVGPMLGGKPACVDPHLEDPGPRNQCQALFHFTDERSVATVESHRQEACRTPTRFANPLQLRPRETK